MTAHSELKTLEGCFDDYDGSNDSEAALVVEKCLQLDKLEATDLTKRVEEVECTWRGVYADQLERWMDIYPPENFLIWVSEDFGKNPGAHLQQLVEWVGLDPSKSKMSVVVGKEDDVKKFHVHAYPAAAPQELIKRLEAFFKPHNQRLFRFLRGKGFADIAERLEAVWAELEFDGRG